LSAGHPVPFAINEKGRRIFAHGPLIQLVLLIAYKTGAQANALVDHHQFAHALRFA
jgi:hypothetical protein